MADKSLMKRSSSRFFFCLSQRAKVGRNPWRLSTPTPLLRTTSSQALSISKDGDSIISLVELSQHSATFRVKIFSYSMFYPRICFSVCTASKHRRALWEQKQQSRGNGKSLFGAGEDSCSTEGQWRLLMKQEHT